jgi:glycosyltransferase involved in cell wall biosynthesis
MADAYAELYQAVIDDHRPLRAPAAAGAAVPRTRGTIRMLGLVDGADGVHPGSAFVRVLSRWGHPSVRDSVSLRLRAPEDDPVRPGTDVVLLQRTALAAGLTSSFLDALRERAIPLVLDLDDHLLLEDRDDPLAGEPRAALAAALDAARLVLVPHDRLAAELEPRVRAVAVVPNLIDERLFLAGVTRRPRRERGAGPVQLVYVGSPTHARDLALLAPVMAELARRHPGAFELNVVGAEPPGPGQNWYRRVIVPDDCKPYPRFVSWLRERRAEWDLALAPLVDTAFNRCKSDLKYVEYSALGLPGVYADLEPYSGVRDGETGLRAAAGATGAWAAAVERLAEDPGLADRLADAGFAEVCAGRLMAQGAGDLLQLIGTVARPR